MMRPKVFHGTYSMTCANNVLPTFMRHPRLGKAESVANTKSQIQIVDTHESLKTLVNSGFPASESQFNRTLLGKNIFLQAAVTKDPDATN